MAFQFYNRLATQNFLSIVSSSTNLRNTIITLSIWVTSIIIIVRLVYQWKNINSKLFVVLTIILLFTVVSFFSTDNLIILYVTFEISLLPTLLLIIKWGYQPERLKSRYYFIIYTICASLPLLFIIIKIKHNLYSSSISRIYPLLTFETKTNYLLIYFSLTIPFMVKVPMWGVHLWLPKAHVEAPVRGSMILAGILLKLGGYGLIKIMTLIYKLTSKIKLVLFRVNLWGAFTVRFICIASVDIKRLIAYSSVIHINMIVLGILRNSKIGVTGAILIIVAHGIRSPGMFALANINYEKNHTRNIIMQKGIITNQPILNLPWFLLIAANIAAPPSLNLAREIIIYIRVLKIGFILCIIIALITFLRGAYNLYLYSSQQINPSIFSIPCTKIRSSNLLISVSHFTPVFLRILIVYLIY